jgi:hypothetical protein
MTNNDLAEIWDEAIKKYKSKAKDNLPIDSAPGTDVSLDLIIEQITSTCVKFEGFKDRRQRLDGVLRPLCSTLMSISAVLANSVKLVGLLGFCS